MKRGTLVILILIITGSLAFASSMGVLKRRPLPDEYGNVFMNNYSMKNNIAPVIFNHWLHRAKYTCRLCHVDLGFAMKAGATGVTEEDNKRGFYCGACHNGKEAFGPKEKNMFGKETKNCARCHSFGQGPVLEKDFYKFTKEFPKGRFGNGIDWEKAEQEGKIRLKDYLEGVSIRRKPLSVPKDFDINAGAAHMPEIIFSHRKHAVWNGCEVCHPEIFDVRKGATKYTMSDIFSGKYCGVCHGKVAFPNLDCQRCHSKPI
ncbi:MAG: cytochrome c3 family protein [Candidatus Sulfobium sp.]